jgi:hypothetical protein
MREPLFKYKTGRSYIDAIKPDSPTPYGFTSIGKAIVRERSVMISKRISKESDPSVLEQL